LPVLSTEPYVLLELIYFARRAYGIADKVSIQFFQLNE
jgi:hypothetical protein